MYRRGGTRSWRVQPASLTVGQSHQVKSGIVEECVLTSQQFMEDSVDHIEEQSIEQLVQQRASRRMSRSRFIATLTGIGATASGVAILASAAEHVRSQAAGLVGARHEALLPQHAQQHNVHIQRQVASMQTAPEAVAAATQHGPQVVATDTRLHHLRQLLDDYADDAVVEDSLDAQPIVGKDAIAKRKLEEMASMRDVSLDMVKRYAYGPQIVAEWVMRGTHSGTYKGFAPTGRQIEVRGVTVVTRANGKIVKESLYYDAADLIRQFS